VKVVTQFIQEVIDQLRQVTWPDKKTLAKLTSVVILVSASLGLFLGGLDVLFTRLVGILVK